ncbi:protein kinase domain-containing protein [Lederbergia graminis]|uniref:Protein kinase family protein n=1 Tax=Lederbergia graminis TaxID=735518 RepID=A0ABW0LGG1_9BACI
MMNNTSKSPCKFNPGTIINGKWHKHRYQLVKELGAGANGVVYLVKGSFGYSALKMSTDSMSITSEVNVLKAFEKVQGSTLGPSLFDVDDWHTKNGTIHFYVMEYIHGPDLLSFISSKGKSWAGIMIVQLLDILENLHKQGWVFGDLKPENLIVSGPPAKIRCIDVGGTTKSNRAIKEFTEFFDRGYWGLGTRKAEPSYDLFSTAMLLVNLYYPKRFSKNTDGKKQLMDVVQSDKGLVRYEPVLKRAFLNQYSSAQEMKKDMLQLLSASDSQPKSNAVRYKSRQVKKQKKKNPIFETVSILILTIVLYALYIYGYIL